MDIIYFSVFNQFADSEKTTKEAIETYKTINAEKISIVSQLTETDNPMQLSAKIDRIYKLSTEENKFLSWIKTKSLASQNINETSSSSESISEHEHTQNYNNYNNRNNGYNSIINNETEINNINNIQSRSAQQKKTKRKDPPIAPEVCTPTSSADEKHNDDNVTPPPSNTFPMQSNGTNVSNHKPPLSPVFNLVMRISELLMQSYPLPMHYNVIDIELQQRFNYGPMVNDLKKGFSYDFISFNQNGFYYVHPDLLEKRLSITKRQRIMKNKLNFLMNNMYKNGINTTNQNVHLIFKHYIGWMPTKYDFQFMNKLLNERKRNVKYYYGNRKALQDVLSYKEILICALQSIDHKGCSSIQLHSEIKNIFGIAMDLNNIYIKAQLEEICDLHVWRIKRHYKLGFETKKKRRALLEWWNKNYSGTNVKYNKYIEPIERNHGNNNMFGSNYIHKHKHSRSDHSLHW